MGTKSTWTGPVVRLLAATTLSYLLLTPSARAGADEPQRFDLLPAQEPGQLHRVDVALDAEGQLKLLLDAEETETVEMRVEGHLVYDEKRLATGTLPEHHPRTLRHYETAEAKLTIGSGTIDAQLGQACRTIIAECAADGQTLYCPAGPLTRDELDLISAPASSLLVDGLLPSEPVAVGDTWSPPNDLLAALLGVDAVGASDVQIRLAAVTDDSAKFELSGTVAGAVDGVSTEIELKGKFRLSRHYRFVDWLAMVIREKRDIGHASPGVDAVARVILKRTPIQKSPALAAAADAEAITLAEHPELALLRYQSPTSSIEFLYERNWHILGEESDRLAMRYIERGELMAQCNVAVLPKVAPGKRLSLEAFQNEIRDALGESFGQITRALETADEQGRAVYIVRVQGQASDLPIEWVYQLVADPEGRQVVFVLTAEEGLADHLADSADRLARTVRFVEPAIQAAASPQPATR